jgi:hypothetical protein
VGAVMGLSGYLLFSKIENCLDTLIKGRNSTTIMNSEYKK